MLFEISSMLLLLLIAFDLNRSREKKKIMLRMEKNLKSLNCLEEGGIPLYRRKRGEKKELALWVED